MQEARPEARAGRRSQPGRFILSAQSQAVPTLPATYDAGAAREDAAVQPAIRKKKDHLPALSGLRAFSAMNIVFYHFFNPAWFGPLSPIVESGYTSVSFFLMLSGFVLAYNYSDRAQKGQLRAKTFWIARASRLYPIYLVALVVSLGMLMEEWHARSHAQFAWGVILTPLMLQGWSPSLSTFWNTPAWTMCTEAFFYLIFPLVVLWRRPKNLGRLVALLLGLWCLGMVLPSLYLWLNPDGVAHVNRYTDGFWIRALKFTPPPHIPSFLFGIVLADVDALIPRGARKRLALGAVGMSGIIAMLYFGNHFPFPLMHDGLLMPLFGMAVLGLAGRNLIAGFFGLAPLVAVGQASYCLYILHFNLWNMIHDHHVVARLGLTKYDPWLSYSILVLAAVLAMKFIEKPAQKAIKRKFGLA